MMIGERFLDFLGKTARKVRGDMAQGPFIEALIDIGSTILILKDSIIVL